MAQAEEVMTKANMVKYEQNTAARQALLETGQRPLLKAPQTKHGAQDYALQTQMHSIKKNGLKIPSI